MEFIFLNLVVTASRLQLFDGGAFAQSVDFLVRRCGAKAWD